MPPARRGGGRGRDAPAATAEDGQELAELRRARARPFPAKGAVWGANLAPDRPTLWDEVIGTRASLQQKHVQISGASLNT